jgi:D-alanyl-D-alanine carboxypeptidase
MTHPTHIQIKNSLTILFTTCLFLSGKAQNKTEPNLQNILDTFITNNKIPSIAIAIVKTDTLIYRTSGNNKKCDGLPIDLSSKFHLGSNSKAITSFMIAKLVETGKLKWETKLLDLFPEFKTTTNPKFENTTIEQILSHTAGIKPYIGSLEIAMLPNFQGNNTDQRYQFTKHTLSKDTLGKVGTYTYSNADYGIAAAILEKATNKTWEELLTQTFTDLQIPTPYIGFPNLENPNNPWGHWQEGGDTLIQLNPEHPYKLPTTLAPAGDLSMSIVDYAKYIQLNLQGLNGTNNYLKAETYQKMHFFKERYALGWGNGKNPQGQQVSTHSGSAGSFIAHAYLCPEKKLAIIVFSNASSPKINELIIKMRRDLFTLYTSPN